MQSHSILLLLATVANLSISALAFPSPTGRLAPAKRALADYGYATFYDDNACTEGAGMAVSMGNDGCLSESGRNSIYVQPGFFSGSGTCLIFYSDNECGDAEGYAIDVSYNNGDNYCLDLNGNPFATSFVFANIPCSEVAK